MNLGRNIDPANGEKWKALMTPKSIGLILRSIKIDYKFVCMTFSVGEKS